MRLVLMTAALCLASAGPSATQERPVTPIKASLAVDAVPAQPSPAQPAPPQPPAAAESKAPAPAAAPETDKPATVVTEAPAAVESPNAAEAPKPVYDPNGAPVYTHQEVCQALVAAAQERDLPLAFFARLIWHESQFKHDAVSPVGAIGIAQFMPAVARAMDIENPFDAREALPASAELLDTLKRRFGNIGLAAAAYNSTPKRIANWLRNKATLPEETRKYVRSITGRPVESWRSAKGPGVLPEVPRYVPCTRVDDFAQLERIERSEAERREAERIVAERAEAERLRVAAAAERAAHTAAKGAGKGKAPAKNAARQVALVTVPAKPGKMAVKVMKIAEKGPKPTAPKGKSPGLVARKVAAGTAKPAKTAGKPAPAKRTAGTGSGKIKVASGK